MCSPIVNDQIGSPFTESCQSIHNDPLRYKTSCFVQTSPKQSKRLSYDQISYLNSDESGFIDTFDDKIFIQTQETAHAK
jgi:hypothetical protein